jgi:hypothetical protein
MHFCRSDQLMLLQLMPTSQVEQLVRSIGTGIFS